MKYNLLGLLTLLCSICLAQGNFDPKKFGYILVWQDEFNEPGKVDSSKWSGPRGRSNCTLTISC